jgi:pyruvate-ferredoxin/flavodoxin oxidoreductase
MGERKMVAIDGNEAAASVAYRLSEVIAIYPITPSSPMGELADEWSAHGRPNLWGTVPDVVEMQSEGGAAGAAHGALQGGALSTTFTASQGLLLMIPNMYKIAGELTPFCMHVAARAVASHALSIFGDHSDVMACRQTGFGMLASGSVQEVQDLACIAHAATLATRIPFLHFFDGFRTSHELAKIQSLDDEALRSVIHDELIAAHRARALTPDRPVLRGTAQNPDVFFQAREACNRTYLEAPAVVQGLMDRFAAAVGRQYRLFEYAGHPEAERVVVLMGSGAETVHETVDWLSARGERVGVLKVRLFRPFSPEALRRALPTTVRRIAVLDRTKEAGAVGEPLYLDVLSALRETASGDGAEPLVVGGRYGLGSKEFTPGMVKSVFEEIAAERPRNHFTVGIIDDVTHCSLDFDREFDLEPDDVFRSVFFGLGSDGTVGANKSSIKIICEGTDHFGQGYFVYDSKKAGAVTISHLRFGPRPIRSTYLIGHARFVACSQPSFLERLDVLGIAAPGAVVLLNAPWGPGEAWDHLPREVQEQVVEKHLDLYVIDAHAVARETGVRGHVNTIMQTCFFAISGVLPRDESIERIKAAIQKTYGKKGDAVVRANLAAVDGTLAHLHRVEVPDRVTTSRSRPPVVPEEAPDFVRRVTAVMLSGHGDLLPVSAFPIDGTWPLGTARWEKRGIAQEIPVWDEALCIQCNKCAMVCPHAAIRAKTYVPEHLATAPATFRSADYRGHEFAGQKYTIQVAPEDCTGCTLCVMVCPAKDKSNPRHKALGMHPQMPLVAAERENFAFFGGLPEVDRASVRTDIKGAQFFEPLFEFSGACAGCGETPYVKLLTQLFGDRILIANATGCSSIYGGNLPTTPYTTNRDGRGPAWANSLFEDNAEFGLGMRLAVDHQRRHAESLLRSLAPRLDTSLMDDILRAHQESEGEIAAQRERVESLRRQLAPLTEPDARRLEGLADLLVRKSVWIVGGDGWAYDIGFGGLDHVLASGRDVNVLVLDTEVYSNTGGQQSKATPLGAAAKFASAGKSVPKKDLGLMMTTYRNVYVARVAFGAKDQHTVRAFQEAESYPGPSLIIAYSHCIAHGYDLALGLEQQKLAVGTGTWPLYRWDPRRLERSENPFQLDSAAPQGRLLDYMRNEARFRMVEHENPERFKELLAAAEDDLARRFRTYQDLARPHSVAAADAPPADKSKA